MSVMGVANAFPANPASTSKNFHYKNGVIVHIFQNVLNVGSPFDHDLVNPDQLIKTIFKCEFK